MQFRQSRYDLPQSIEAFVGERVHEALEYLHGEHWKNKYLSSPRELTDFYKQRWIEMWHAGVRVQRWKEGCYLQDGLTCLRNYYEANYPFNESRTVALEREVTFQLEYGWDDLIKFTGRVDRIASLPDGTYEIHEYKTGRLNEMAFGSARRQLGLYQYALQSMNPEADHVELILHFLGPGKTFRWYLNNSELIEIVEDWAA